jgi:hypothetical protein
LSHGIHIAVERPVRADVAALLRASRAMMAALYPPGSCHGLELGAYERAEVTLFVARAHGLAVSCGAFQLHGDGSAELKSMFVAPDAAWPRRRAQDPRCDRSSCARPRQRFAPRDRGQAAAGDPPV